MTPETTLASSTRPVYNLRGQWIGRQDMAGVLMVKHKVPMTGKNGMEQGPPLEPLMAGIYRRARLDTSMRRPSRPRALTIPKNSPSRRPRRSSDSTT